MPGAATQLAPGRLLGGLAGFSSAPFASLCQTPQTSPTVAIRGRKRQKCLGNRYTCGPSDEAAPYSVGIQTWSAGCRSEQFFDLGNQARQIRARETHLRRRDAMIPDIRHDVFVVWVSRGQRDGGMTDTLEPFRERAKEQFVVLQSAGAFASPWCFGGAPVSKPAYCVLLLQDVHQTIREL
jgi:hypothetical protein